MPERPTATPTRSASTDGQTDPHALRRLQTLVESLNRPNALPGATYRVQFNAGFTFRDASRIAPYLHDLGITHLYASPYLKARSGSTHGYDVADPSSLNPELGTEQDFADLVATLDRLGMGQVVDIVPNHMGIGDPGNYRWLDVLENGPSSIYASFFDINWNPLKPELKDQNKVILPVLGDQYGQVLERGELVLGYEDGAFHIQYWDNRWPLSPRTYAPILAVALEHMEDVLSRRHEHVQELQSILTALRYLPPLETTDPAAREERNREKEIVKRRIRLLDAASAPFRDGIQHALQTYTGTPEDRASFDRLDELLDSQAYRLAFWRVASEEINYRRFFDIAELAAVRMEDPRVFEETHRLLLRLVGEGKVHGLRIDHPDGLKDPAGYFRQLQRSSFVKVYAGLLRDQSPDGLADARLGALFDWLLEHRPRSPLLRSLYVVAEKILHPGEPLRTDWLIHGTTGYDFLNILNGIFVDRASEKLFDAIYSRFVRAERRFGDLANSTKKMMMLIFLASEVNELGYHIKRIASSDRRFRDFTLNSLTFVIREIIASLSVYRTYVDPTTGAMGEIDRRYVEDAVADAKRRNPRTDASIFDFVSNTLLLKYADDLAPEERDDLLQFVAKFQQTTGPVMAKGVEDTAFYVYNRLVSLNEVGGEPDHFGLPLATFHRYNLGRARQWPSTMLATSTHDTKRSEDVRARINVLSEMPREWRTALTRWSRLNGRKKPLVDGRPAPDRNEEYLLYQVLLGAWPAEWPAEPLPEFSQRIAQFMLKAAREGKVNTSWINPSQAWEAALEQFVHAILDPAQPNPFLDDFRGLAEHIAYFGYFNALSQILLKLTAPGVPDVYQGNETWDFSLVDPDNRRPVDYALRARMLQDVIRASEKDASSEFCRDLVQRKEDGRIKLYVTHRALALRRQLPDLFRRGSYDPLRADGPRTPVDPNRHVCAFARTLNGSDSIVVAVPVLVAGLTRGSLIPPTGPQVWGEGRLLLPHATGQRYQDVFTGEVLTAEVANGRAGLPLASLFEYFPLALLRALD